MRGIHLLVGIHSTLFPFLFPLSIYSIFFLSFVFSSSIFFLFVRETGNGGKAINLISGNELRKNYFYFHVFTSLHNGPENCGHFFLLLLLLLWTCTTLVQGYSSSAWVRFKTGLARPIILNQRNKICKKLLVYSWGRSKKARKSSTRVEHALDVNN